MQTHTGCHYRKKHVNVNAGSSFSWLSGILIALIPKCPFCILAYSSAITVCSSKSLAAYTPDWTSSVSIAFSFLTLIITLYNYKGYRTQLACLLILIGSSLIVYSEIFTGVLTTYYWGCAILILGVWTNGSLPFFISSVKLNAFWHSFSKLQWLK